MRLRLEPGSRLSYLVALAIGATVALSVFPSAALLPSLGNDFARPTDAMQHIIGQRYFIFTPWAWPLLDVPRLGAPEGTNIALTDSIPLFALLLKLVRGILPAGFHGIYLWIALCWTLQPAAAVFALRSAGERRLMPAICVSVIAASTPTLLFRMQHAALCSHFLILTALGLYFRMRHGGAWATFCGLPLLLAASLLIHPYLLVMVAAVLAAAPLSLLGSHWRLWLRTSCAFAGGLLLTGLLAWVLGYGGADIPAGFDFYSMNLLSPFYPAGSGLLPHFGSSPDATGGQYEGYQYLGLGVLLLVAVSAARWPRQSRLLRRHGWLLVIMITLSCVALSNRVYFGHRLLLDLEPMPSAMQLFRSSGRFFWPVTYTVMIASTALVARWRRVGTFALLVAAVIQFADAAPLRQDVRLSLLHPPPWAVNAAGLRPVLASSHSLTLWPPFRCGPGDYVDPPFMQMLLLGSERLVTTNTMYTARTRGAWPCDATTLATTPLAMNEMLVLLDPVEDAGALSVPDGRELCRRLDPLFVCARQLGALAGLPSLQAPIIPTDQIIGAASPLFLATLGLGWTQPGAEGVWSGGHTATLVASTAEGAGVLTVWGHALAPRQGDEQRVTVMINDVEVASWSVPDQLPTVLRAPIAAPTAANKPLLIRFVIDSPTRPIDRGMSSDTRQLGFFMSAFRLAGQP